MYPSGIRDINHLKHGRAQATLYSRVLRPTQLLKDELPPTKQRMAKKCDGEHLPYVIIDPKQKQGRRQS